MKLKHVDRDRGLRVIRDARDVKTEIQQNIYDVLFPCGQRQFRGIVAGMGLLFQGREILG